MDFTSAGVAAGVAAGFNSPIGGMLFAMEDLSSFWSKSLTWLVFTCCIVSVIVCNLFNAAFSGFSTREAPFGVLADIVSRPQ
jgi:chloride channel 7